MWERAEENALAFLCFFDHHLSRSDRFEASRSSRRVKVLCKGPVVRRRSKRFAEHCPFTDPVCVCSVVCACRRRVEQWRPGPAARKHGCAWWRSLQWPGSSCNWTVGWTGFVAVLGSGVPSPAVPKRPFEEWSRRMESMPFLGASAHSLLSVFVVLR